MSPKTHQEQGRRASTPAELVASLASMFPDFSARFSPIVMKRAINVDMTRQVIAISMATPASGVACISRFPSHDTAGLTIMFMIAEMVACV